MSTISPRSAESTPPLFDSGASGSTETAGSRTDQSRGHTFPCDGCGADLVFHIGQQKLKCPYCGFEKEIALDEEAAIVEQDFHAILQRVAEQRRDGTYEAHREDAQKEVRCDGCGGTVLFTGSLTSSECPYCGSPIQIEDAHTAESRIPVDGVLGFLVAEHIAKKDLAEWVRSRWFAPTEFRKRGVQGRFNGVYLPYWTFDSLTLTRYRGERGEHYYVTVGTGKNQRQERRTRWYPASGTFQRFFDDVLVTACRGLNGKLVRGLEPWPLDKCLPFNREMLAGYLARTYEVELDGGFVEARRRIDEALREDVGARIGGDTQRIHSIDTRHDALTFKHLLLPVWLLAYRFHDKPYQVLVNAATGEIQGERPWSWVKIALAVLAALAVAGGLAWFFHARSQVSPHAFQLDGLGLDFHHLRENTPTIAVLPDGRDTPLSTPC
ncbi:MAG: hypothetical protein WD069_21950 [Planctomycetales bacterium]